MPIRKIVDATWGKLSGMWKLVLVVGVGLLFLLLTWYYGASLVNTVDNWWNRRRTEAAQKQISDLQQQADAAKQVAQQALAELAAEKRVTAEERSKREAAERVLADKSLTANQKLRAYEEAIKQPITITPTNTDTDDLCRRAAALGIQCGS